MAGSALRRIPQSRGIRNHLPGQFEIDGARESEHQNGDKEATPQGTQKVPVQER